MPEEGAFLAPGETVMVRVNPEPVQDIDGDRHKEIVVSIFNRTGDGRWHILALDPLSGTTRFDLPGQFLTGLRDADGDGRPDLFCTAVDPGPRIPEPASLSIWTLQGGQPAQIWNQSETSFVTYGMRNFPYYDVEGNGAAQIVVGCADGNVYGIGPLQRTNQVP